MTDRMETTLVILKPDAVQRGLVGRIISRFEDRGFEIAAAKMIRMTPPLAERLYQAHRGKPFYEGLVRFITSSPVLVLAVHGMGAIKVTRGMLGATFCSAAEPGTIRGDFGLSNSFNLIHGSDSPESAASEIRLFFEAEELLDYARDVDRWVYNLTSGQPE